MELLHFTSLSPNYCDFLFIINAYPCGFYVKGQMETFLRKYFKEKMQEQGQRRMQVRDNTAASEVRQRQQLVLHS